MLSELWCLLALPYNAAFDIQGTQEGTVILNLACVELSRFGFGRIVARFGGPGIKGRQRGDMCTSKSETTSDCRGVT